ncbi:MAG: DUF1566 domain-containing protein [Syntrophales bacterium]
MTESVRDRRQPHAREKGIPLIEEKGKAIMKKILVVVCLALLLGSFVSVECATAADRFVKNNDGTVTDTQTGLMWADKDNGSSIDWNHAREYCDVYNGGGKSGWRMPTIDEIGKLYNSGAYGSVIKKTGYAVWVSEIRGNDPAECHWDGQHRGWEYQNGICRALPVRSGR